MRKSFIAVLVAAPLALAACSSTSDDAGSAQDESIGATAEQSDSLTEIGPSELGVESEENLIKVDLTVGEYVWFEIPDPNNFENGITFESPDSGILELVSDRDEVEANRDTAKDDHLAPIQGNARAVSMYKAVAATGPLGERLAVAPLDENGAVIADEGKYYLINIKD